MAAGFLEAADKLAGEGAYNREAYFFLRDALEATLKRRKKSRRESSGHVTPAELLDGFRQHALQEFGPMAVTVLDFWGVRSCEDIGRMVFGLVDAGVFGKTEHDSLEDFRAGYDFDEAFARPFRPESPILSKIASAGVRSGE